MAWSNCPARNSPVSTRRITPSGVKCKMSRTHWWGRQGKGRLLRSCAAAKARQAGHHARGLGWPGGLVGKPHGSHLLLLLLRLLQRVLQLKRLLLLLARPWRSSYRRACARLAWHLTTTVG